MGRAVHCGLVHWGITQIFVAGIWRDSGTRAILSSLELGDARASLDASGGTDVWERT